MSLRAKLARMTAPPASLRPGRVAPPSDELAGRAGIGEDLANTGAEARSKRNWSAPASFETVETSEGVLYRRVLRYDASHPVGRSALGPAGRARAEGIARLALDPSLGAIDPASFLYVDTETTGLAGGTGTIAFLVGMAYFEGASVVLEQLLVSEPGDEAPALARFAAAAEASGGFVTYNGKSFDLPLLRARYALNRLAPLPARPHLDLVHVARRLHGRRLGRCSLRSVEGSVLGFERSSSITSAEVVGRYRAFLRTGEGALLDDVAEHNAFDVLSLVALVALYDDPVAALCPADLVALSRVLARAGAGGEAQSALGAAAGRAGEGPEVLAARSVIAKLYEHGLGQPDEALRLVEQGTGEEGATLERRRRRLVRKLARAAQPALPGFEALVGPGAGRVRRARPSVIALREGEQGRNLRLDGLELADGELNLGLAQPPRGVDEIE